VPDDAVMVVRGDVLDTDLLNVAAARFSGRYPDWDRTGVSGYDARDEREVVALCQTKLVNFETVAVFTRTSCNATASTWSEPFEPPHVTLAAGAKSPAGAASTKQSVSVQRPGAAPRDFGTTRRSLRDPGSADHPSTSLRHPMLRSPAMLPQMQPPPAALPGASHGIPMGCHGASLRWP